MIEIPDEYQQGPTLAELPLEEFLPVAYETLSLFSETAGDDALPEPVQILALMAEQVLGVALAWTCDPERIPS